MLAVFVIDSTGPETRRLVEAVTVGASVDVTVTVFVATPGEVAVALIVKVCVCVTPLVGNVRPLQVTVVMPPLVTTLAPGGVELTYVKPEGSGSAT